MKDYLLQLLATYKVYEYNVHNLHWQVRGPINGDIHLRMKDHYEYAEDVMDDVAERIMMLQGEIPTKMCDLVEKSYIKFMDKIPNLEEGISLVIQLQTHMIDLLKKGIKESCDSMDYHTEDMLRGYCAWHEKQRWLLDGLFPKASFNLNIKGDEKLDPKSN